MVDPTLRPGSLPLAPLGAPSVPGAANGAASKGDPLSGARFQALLEDLDLRAKAMAKSAGEPLSPEALPAAVEQARTSLADALSLGNSLLEACRQLATQTPEPRP
jgi:hypothetical protein